MDVHFHVVDFNIADLSRKVTLFRVYWACLPGFACQCNYGRITGMNIQIPAFETVKILVVGDVMLDRYWHGSTSRISPEAPVPVVCINQLQNKAGGAGNVALNIAALGGQAILMGVIGQDEAGDTLVNSLEAEQVNCQFQRVKDIQTITKLRVISHHQQLIRLDFEEATLRFSAEKLLKDFKKLVPKVNAVVLSDYNKGTLAPVLTDLIDAAREVKVPVFIDPKLTHFGSYRGATLLTPNAKEFTAMAGEWQTEEDLERLGQAAMQQYNIEAILVTRSEHGMTLLQRNQPPVSIPTKAQEIFDVTGAGDTVIAALAAAMAAGQDVIHAMGLANLAAGLVVAKVGAATVSVPELRRALHEEHLSGESVVDIEQLLLIREMAKAQQETVVMTNGCFDILHAGHIAYLEQAKKLGDKLIVAVNSDASVQRLKGKTRPIMPLAQRIAVLASLKPVDYVIAFDEDTPEGLIKKVLPDVLVKGGDYKIEEIAGSKAVLANGGKVKILCFEEGCSTTNLIKKIKGEAA